MNEKKPHTIMIVDDDPNMLDSAKMLLEKHGYSIIPCDSARKAIDKIQKEDIDIVLTDIMMPVMTGMDLLKKIHDLNKELPVILMTAYAELDLAIDAVKEGAFDFITKPFKPEYILHTIEKAIDYQRLIELEKNYKTSLEDTVVKRTEELENALLNIDSLNKEIIFRLTAVAEFRDTDTGAHIKRVGRYSGEIAKSLKMSESFIETIIFASSLHDIGKIGIKDKILLKTGSLTPEEFNVMKSHATIGEKMLSGSSHALLQMATKIALTHHERWDGTGYPRNLKNDNIPVEGRITVICDQYDALRSKRPYKKPFSHEETVKIIIEGDQRTRPEHFDPDVLNAFKEIAPEFEKIYDSVVDLH